jgi:hypothetical protein
VLLAKEACTGEGKIANGVWVWTVNTEKDLTYVGYNQGMRENSMEGPKDREMRECSNRQDEVNGLVKRVSGLAVDAH